MNNYFIVKRLLVFYIIPVLLKMVDLALTYMFLGRVSGNGMVIIDEGGPLKFLFHSRLYIYLFAITLGMSLLIGRILDYLWTNIDTSFFLEGTQCFILAFCYVLLVNPIIFNLLTIHDYGFI